MAKWDKTMFAIYRDAAGARAYRAVYYTELREHEKDREIARSMAGEPVFDGFLDDRAADSGKRAIAGVLDRLNAGEALPAEQIGAMLTPHLVR